VPSLLKGSIFVALVVTLVAAFPSEGLPKKSVLGSKIGGEMVKQVAVVERTAANIFTEAMQETLTFLTVEPQPTSSEKVPLKFKTTEVQTDPEAEKQMLAMLNRERSAG
jgi:hypothetical protein